MLPITARPPMPEFEVRVPYWAVCAGGARSWSTVLVSAHTASEARARAKPHFGIGPRERLPVGARAVRALPMTRYGWTMVRPTPEELRLGKLTSRLADQVCSATGVPAKATRPR